jgi:hypothetical protein
MSATTAPTFYTYKGWDPVTPGIQAYDINEFNKAPLILMWHYALTNMPNINPPDLATFAASLNTSVFTVQRVLNFCNSSQNSAVQQAAGIALQDVQELGYGGGTGTSCLTALSLPKLAAAAAATWNATS